MGSVVRNVWPLIKWLERKNSVVVFLTFLSLTSSSVGFSYGLPPTVLEVFPDSDGSVFVIGERQLAGERGASIEVGRFLKNGSVHPGFNGGKILRLKDVDGNPIMRRPAIGYVPGSGVLFAGALAPTQIGNLGRIFVLGVGRNGEEIRLPGDVTCPPLEFPYPDVSNQNVSVEPSLIGMDPQGRILVASLVWSRDEVSTGETSKEITIARLVSRRMDASYGKDGTGLARFRVPRQATTLDIHNMLLSENGSAFISGLYWERKPGGALESLRRFFRLSLDAFGIKNSVDDPLGGRALGELDVPREVGSILDLGGDAITYVRPPGDTRPVFDLEQRGINGKFVRGRFITPRFERRTGVEGPSDSAHLSYLSDQTLFTWIGNEHFIRYSWLEAGTWREISSAYLYHNIPNIERQRPPQHPAFRRGLLTNFLSGFGDSCGRWVSRWAAD